MRGDRLVTCLADGPVGPDGHGTICVRPDRHAGPCRFVPDDEVVVHLTPAGRTALYRSQQAELEVIHAR
jgi:hypothetical protein